MASVAAVTEAPYGEWKSPLSAVDVAEAGRQISSIRVRGRPSGPTTSPRSTAVRFNGHKSNVSP